VHVHSRPGSTISVGAGTLIGSWPPSQDGTARGRKWFSATPKPARSKVEYDLVEPGVRNDRELIGDRRAPMMDWLATFFGAACLTRPRARGFDWHAGCGAAAPPMAVVRLPRWSPDPSRRWRRFEMRALWNWSVRFLVRLCRMFSVSPDSLIKDQQGNLPPPARARQPIIAAEPPIEDPGH
jgi:hypothetical protein